MPEAWFPRLRPLSKYIPATFLSSLVAGRFAYLSLLYLEEIKEFEVHFRDYGRRKVLAIGKIC